MNQLTMFDYCTPLVTPFNRLGGKRLLKKALARHAPHDAQYSRYIEPCVGAGHFLFYLGNSNALICDTDPLVIDSFLTLRDNLDTWLCKIDNWRRAHCKEYFYEVSQKDNKDVYDWWYLKPISYLGLGTTYIENRPRNWDAILQRFRRASEFLQGVEIRQASVFDLSISDSPFIYIDPPYLETEQKQYHEKWGRDKHLDLARKVREYIDGGARVMLSLSPNCAELYEGWAEVCSVYVYYRMSNSRKQEIIVKAGY